MSVLELRQYTLVPGRRDELIDLFEAELLTPQEEAGMQIIGTFRDLKDEQRFVWIRGFPDMPRRASSLHSFYGGPVWRHHRAAANATMIDSDNVLLLRPAWPDRALQLPPRSEAAVSGPGVVQLGIVSFGSFAEDAVLTYFTDEIEPLIERAGARMLACLLSERAPNTFPALPVREGESVLVWLAGFPDARSAQASAESPTLHRAVTAWPDVAGTPDIRLLAPTRSSRLMGTSRPDFASRRVAGSPA